MNKIRKVCPLLVAAARRRETALWSKNAPNGAKRGARKMPRTGAKRPIAPMIGSQCCRAKAYEALMRESAKRWEKLYPDDFFTEICRLLGVKPNVNGKYPWCVGKFIRRFVYEPILLSDGLVLSRLDEKNPVHREKQGRKTKHHRFLDDDARLAVKQQIWQVIGIAKSVKNIIEFQIAFLRAFPRHDSQLSLFD